MFERSHLAKMGKERGPYPNTILMSESGVICGRVIII